MAAFRSLFATAIVTASLLAVGGLANVAFAQSGNAIVAFTEVRLIDGTGGPVVEPATLVVRNGRITAVGPAAAVRVPDGATRVDLSGKTVVPGFINAHGHLNAGDPDQPRRERLLSQLRVYADYGVTTVVVLGAGEGDLEETVRLRHEQEQGSLDRARVYVAGPTIRDLPTAAQARAQVDAYADANADIVKIHITGEPSDMTPSVYGALIDEAHMRGLQVAAHLYYLEDAHGLVDANVDVIAHSVRDQDVDAALIEKIRAQNVGYIPTLTRDLARFVYESTPDFFDDPFLLRHADFFGEEMAMLRDPALREEYRTSAPRQDDKRGLAQGQRNLKTLSDAGVLIALGTDSGTNAGQWQGYFEHTELQMMVDSGMSPMQVLVAATGTAARVMDLDDDLGTLEPGRWADLVVLDANPLEDIRATREIDSVWMAGTRVSRPD